MDLTAALDSILSDWAEAVLAIDQFERGDETGIPPKLLELHLNEARTRLERISDSCIHRNIAGRITPKVWPLLDAVRNASLRLLDAVNKIDPNDLDSVDSRSALRRLSYGLKALENAIHQLRIDGSKLDSLIADQNTVQPSATREAAEGNAQESSDSPNSEQSKSKTNVKARENEAFPPGKMVRATWYRPFLRLTKNKLDANKLTRTVLRLPKTKRKKESYGWTVDCEAMNELVDSLGFTPPSSLDELVPIAKAK